MGEGDVSGCSDFHFSASLIPFVGNVAVAANAEVHCCQALCWSALRASRPLIWSMRPLGRIVNSIAITRGAAPEFWRKVEVTGLRISTLLPRGGAKQARPHGWPRLW